MKYPHSLIRHSVIFRSRDCNITNKLFKYEKVEKHNFAGIPKRLQDFYEHERGKQMRNSEQIVTLSIN